MLVYYKSFFKTIESFASFSVVIFGKRLNAVMLAVETLLRKNII